MKTDSLELHPDRIVITIPTHCPAADVNRYLTALFRTIKVMQLQDFTDDNEDQFTLLELFEHLHPIPKENELQKMLKID